MRVHGGDDDLYSGDVHRRHDLLERESFLALGIPSRSRKLAVCHIPFHILVSNSLAIPVPFTYNEDSN
jgi:hypothetical protein